MLETQQNSFLSVILYISLGSARSQLDNYNDCPSGWHKINDDCFYISPNLRDQYKMWEDANTICVKYGAFLTRPTTSSQVQVLAGLLRGLPGICWVGANNLANGTYTWTNGRQVTSGWRDKEPYTTDRDHCVTIHYYGGISDTGDGLEAWPCNRWRRYICQMSLSSTTTTHSAGTMDSTTLPTKVSYESSTTSHTNITMAPTTYSTKVFSTTTNMEASATTPTKASIKTTETGPTVTTTRAIVLGVGGLVLCMVLVMSNIYCYMRHRH